MKPLIIFPSPRNKPYSGRTTGWPRPPKHPSKDRQNDRLSPRMEELESAFNKGRVEVKDAPEGFTPERMLVLETVGSVDKLRNAASKLPGFEFLFEHLGDSFEADIDFYFENKPEKSINSHIYLSMANESALNQLFKMWRDYCSKKNYKFPRGFTPFRDVFDSLKDLRYWNTEDRLRESGLLEDWSFRVEFQPEQPLPVEIELWFRSDQNARSAAEERVRALVTDLGGHMLGAVAIDGIAYHALLAQVLPTHVEALLKDGVQDISLLRSDDVMHFRPVGQCKSPFQPIEEDLINFEEGQEGEPIPEGASPIVALLDGLPLENHLTLSNRLIVDDPDNFSERYQPGEQVHGTAMASLIAHGDLESTDSLPLDLPIYVRPILAPDESDSFNSVRLERTPDDQLVIDLVHRAVKRMFEGDGEEEATAPNVRIINLSVADPGRLFDKVMSPWARLIDWLSHKYQVVFVVSAGNHELRVETGITTAEFNKLTDEEREALFIKTHAESSHVRRLMSPAESINAVTVGSYHSDLKGDIAHDEAINPLITEGLPSPLNPVSWGRKRSMKPEVLMAGGRQIYTNTSTSNDQEAYLAPLYGHSISGQKVATPSIQPGNLNGYMHTTGTSNAAALATRRLAILHGTLQDLYLADEHQLLTREYEAPLLKSLLVHGAEVGENYNRLASILRTPQNSSKLHSEVARFLGYGAVNEGRIHGCLDNQATLLQCGNIEQGATQVYRLPLPASLNAQAVNRRLIITLAWFSPVNASHQVYRQAHLWFEPPAKSSEDNVLDTQSRSYDWQMVRNGTVQHEVLYGDKAAVYAKDSTIDIAIHCSAKAGGQGLAIPYGLVVTLDTPDSELPIYEEVSVEIEQTIKATIEAAKAPLET